MGKLLDKSKQLLNNFEENYFDDDAGFSEGNSRSENAGQIVKGATKITQRGKAKVTNLTNRVKAE